MAGDTRTSATHRRPRDNVPDTDWRNRRRPYRPVIAPDEVARRSPVAERSWILEAPRLELLESDHPGGGEAGRSSDGGVVARASSRTK